MNEDIHIEKAARLADKPGAEDLATDRAREFVARAMASRPAEPSFFKSLFARRPAFAWGGVAFALVACAAVAVMVFRPSAGGNVIPGYGTPGQLQEIQSVHAGTEPADTSLTESSDSVFVETIVLPE